MNNVIPFISSINSAVTSPSCGSREINAPIAPHPLLKYKSSSTRSITTQSTSISTSSTTSKKSNSGRTPGNIQYTIVTFNGKKIVVATILFNAKDTYFIFDYDDYETVLQRSWHVTSGKYIGSNFKLPDNTIKEVFLHNFLIKGLVVFDEDEKEYVTHINKNAYDNRRENLRVVKAADLLLSKSRKKRNIVLPDDAGISPNDIPKHINYVKPSGDHGARFSVELPTLGIFWKTSSSSKLSIKEKLDIAKMKLKEIYAIYPEMDPNKDEMLVVRLDEEFQQILNLAGDSIPFSLRSVPC